MTDFIDDLTAKELPACFESYKKLPEYQEEYWQQINVDGKYYRRMAHGRKIEVNGITLFTKDRVPPKEAWSDPNTVPTLCTEQISGYAVYLYRAAKMPEEVIKKAKYARPVMTLPIKAESEEE
jgi:hypothetical protein